MGIRFGMFQPCVGVGRKIGIFRKNMLRSDEFFQLNQETALADISVEWIEWLHLVYLVCAHVAFAERRHAQINKGMLQGGATEAARRLRYIRSLNDPMDFLQSVHSAISRR